MRTFVSSLMLFVVLVALVAVCKPSLAGSLQQDYFLDDKVDDGVNDEMNGDDNYDDYNGDDSTEEGHLPLELMNKTGDDISWQRDDEEMMEIDPSEFALNPNETYENGIDDGADDNMIVGPLKSATTNDGSGDDSRVDGNQLADRGQSLTSSS